jgi:hypothetical protein
MTSTPSACATPLLSSLVFTTFTCAGLMPKASNSTGSMPWPTLPKPSMTSRPVKDPGLRDRLMKLPTP